MRNLLIIVCTMLLASESGSALAVQIAALDFTNNGSAWNITEHTTEIPLVFEKDGDPTKIGFEHPNTDGSGHYSLTQQVFAPAGMSMTNIRLEALGSGYSSWIMDGRVGFGLEENLNPLQYKYGASANNFKDPTIPGDPGNNGTVVVDFPLFLDTTIGTGSPPEPGFTPTPSIWVSVEVVKLLGHVSQHADVSQIVITADLTAIPAGDLNGDLSVDGQDFLDWQRGLTAPALDPTALAEWQTNYPSSLAVNLGAVPEPNSLVLVTFMTVYSIAFHRRNSQ
ncbi:hypothetical protein [Bythopirellula goksoeyrii]|uniref:PEP-CTERM protein-sorting domain-containing protein n=1 Tax=Bythopirellula goksoeyrii TaxID=1400387 RepID=A0A5B9Q305_9BACT|nr:hypothetical protein [Bythopirellula goksoeyrii]QEG33418.1 hypothetical protein Pr1d_06810 [Bythopirellula goksoeyrii]